MRGSVIRYDGKRGVVWRIKYADSSGKQVMETVGREADGWTRRKAEEALQDRLSDVRRKGYRKPAALTFAEAAERWFASERVSRAWKVGTASQYRHSADDLCDYFGGRVAAIKQRHCIAFRDWALADSSYRAASSVNSRLTVLRMILAWARDAEYREDVPTIRYAKVRDQYKGAALKPEQVRALLKAFDDAQARAAS